MKKRWKIRVTETRETEVIVEAENKDEACRMAARRTVIANATQPMTEVRCRVLDKDA